VEHLVNAGRFDRSRTPGPARFSNQNHRDANGHATPRMGLKKGVPAMLLRKVEQFLKRHDMAATKFGRLAAGDPRFVLDLRLGRIPRSRTQARTEEWMARYDASEAARSPQPNIEVKGYAHV